MTKVRVRTAVAGSLNKGQVLIFIRVVHTTGRKWGDLFRQQVCIIRDGYPLGYFPRVDHAGLVLDEGPFEGFLGAVDIKTFPVLPGCIEERAGNLGRQVGILVFDVASLDRKG